MRLATAIALLACACAAPDAAIEARSLLGRPLAAMELSPEVHAQREFELEQARAAWRAAPDDEEATIWYGRRLAYLGRYRDAVDVYTAGLRRHPDSAKLRRHRGHRLITLRRFAEAEADLEAAALLAREHDDEVEPDGQPNALGIPRSTLKSNIHYHLGLARYLRGDLEGARDAYRAALRFSRVNDDMLVATSHWLYMTLRRLGRDAEAAAVLEPIRAEMDVIENHAYHRLLLMYRGELSPDDLLGDGDDGIQSATSAYGVGNFLLCEGDVDAAERVFEAIVAGEAWPAFGHIAAEADLARGLPRQAR